MTKRKSGSTARPTAGSAREARVVGWPVAAPQAAHQGPPAFWAQKKGPGENPLSHLYGINEENLETRRQFLRLGEEERALLATLAPWARSVAPEIAREFYEWQLNFPPTREFFERFSQARNMPIANLRQHLEAAQVGYYSQIFEGAASNWGVDYFEQRLKVGKLHDKIDLPLKWYIGSYTEYERLTDIYLRKSFKDTAKILQAERAISKIFNLDIQAIVDAFLMSTLESLGLSTEMIQTKGDKTEHLIEMKRMIFALLEQLELLGKGDLRTSKFDALTGEKSMQQWALGRSVGSLVSSLRSFIAEMKRMSEEHDRGEIDIAIPPEKFEGDYRVMAQGVNDMVGGHISVNKKAMACVTEFGIGNFEAPLERFAGKRVAINDTIEQVRSNLKALITDTDALVNAAVEGKLEARADSTKHQGDFRKIVDGVNRTLDAILLPVGESNRILAQISNGKIDEQISAIYKGDHEKMKQAVNNVGSVLQGLQKELSRLTIASREGKLSERGNSDQFQGAYANIVSGINAILDAVITPLNVAANYVERISKGDIPPQITDTYSGEFNTIKNNLNTLIAAMDEVTRRH